MTQVTDNNKAVFFGNYRRPECFEGYSVLRKGDLYICEVEGEINELYSKGWTDEEVWICYSNRTMSEEELYKFLEAERCS